MKTVLMKVVAFAAALGLCSYAHAERVIAVNFVSSQGQIEEGEDSGIPGLEIPGVAWNNTTGAAQTGFNVTGYDTTAGAPITGSSSLTFSSANEYQWTDATTGCLKGYLDDGGNRANISLTGIPFATYDIIILAATDTADRAFRPVQVNGATYTAAAETGEASVGSANWGASRNLTPIWGTNVMRVRKQAGDLTIKGGNNANNGRGGIAAIIVVESQAQKAVVEGGDAYAISDGVLDETADIVELHLNANAVLTIDAAVTRQIQIVSSGKVTIQDTASRAMTADDLTNLANRTQGLTYRIVGDYSQDGTTPSFGAGVYEYVNAKILDQQGADYIIHTTAGSAVTLVGANNAPRTSVSCRVDGGTLTLGSESNNAFWLGASSTFVQTAGTVNVPVVGTAQSDSGSGLLLGYSGNGITQMEISGGELVVENSSLNFWVCPLLKVSGEGSVLAKGVFRGSGNGRIEINGDDAMFSIGSLGWTADVPLSFMLGTLTAHETTTIAAPITIGDEQVVVNVPGAKMLSITGSITVGEGAIVKYGEGVLSLGESRPCVWIEDGAIRLIASPDEISAARISLPVPSDVSSVSMENIQIVDSSGKTIELNGDPTIDRETSTMTISLLTLPTVEEDMSLSDLELDPADSGMLIIKGGDTPETMITFTFDQVLPENVSVTVLGHVALKVANGIEALPLEKITFRDNAVITIDTDTTMTIPSTLTVIATAGTHNITNNGTFKADGEEVAVTIVNNGTLDILSGTCEVTANAQKLLGTVNVAYGATMKNMSNDAVGYNSASIVNVYGTLDMTTHRWTLGNGTTLNLYAGSQVLGVGDKDGALDILRDGNTINVRPRTEPEFAEMTTVSIEGIVRIRHTAANIWVGNGMKLALPGGLRGADVADAVVTRRGDGHLTGVIPLDGKVTLNYGEGIGHIPARFVANSGTSILKWSGNDANQICTADSKDAPFIEVKPNATLKLDVRDFAGWNGQLTSEGWIVNNGTLVFGNFDGSRFFRNHLVIGSGASVKVDSGARKIALYGGIGSAESAQIMLDEGTASIIAGTEGAGAALHVGNDGAGGYGTKGAGIAVGKGAMLTIELPISGGDPLAKWGDGTLKLTGALTGFTGTFTLNGGRVNVPTELNVTTTLRGKTVDKVVETDGTITYRLLNKGLAIQIL